MATELLGTFAASEHWEHVQQAVDDYLDESDFEDWTVIIRPFAPDLLNDPEYRMLHIASGYIAAGKGDGLEVEIVEPPEPVDQKEKQRLIDSGDVRLFKQEPERKRLTVAFGSHAAGVDRDAAFIIDLFEGME